MKRLIIAALAGALVVTACGGDDSVEASNSLNVQMTDDFAFAPDKVAVFQGDETTIELVNTGSVEHQWVLLQRGTRIEEETEIPDAEGELPTDFAYFQASVPPGETQTFTFVAPEAGSYQIICVVPGHFTAGMEGRLQSVRG